MKKRILSFFLLLTIVFGCFSTNAFASETETLLPLDFTELFQKELGLSAKEWFDPAGSRALLTILIAFDAMSNNHDLIPDLESDSFVGLVDSYLGIAINCNDTYWIFVFEPAACTCYARNTNLTSSALIKTAMENIEMTVQCNSLEEIARVMDLFNDLI